MIIHDLLQGSPEWVAFRFGYYGASEAAAMLGLSKTTTRTELLHLKHTGAEKEFSDYVQKNVLDYGHEVEALARPLVEAIIGEDLYPVTCSDGIYSASCDGLTMDEGTAFEHKRRNKALVDAIERGDLPEEYMPQCQQILMVTGAKNVIFTVSDGTEESMLTLDILPNQSWFDRIRDGWDQFSKDLAAYVPPEVIPAAVATPTMNLPAVSVQVQGSISLVSNLDLFGTALKGFIAKIPEKPSTDQEFADCKSAIGKLQNAQDALDAAEANALGQIATFDDMRRTKALYFDLARTTRLALEKLVTQREGAVKVEIVQEAKALYEAHVDALKLETGGMWIALAPPNFAEAIKNKRTVASLQNAVNTALANGKIAADASAKGVRASLACLKLDGEGFDFLFSDRIALIGKPIDDLKLLIKSRIAEHQRAEAEKLEAQRKRIQVEEEAKAVAKVKAEQEAAAAAEDALIESLRKESRRIEGDSVQYIWKAIVGFESVAKDWESDPRQRVASAVAEARKEMHSKLDAAKVKAEQEAAAKPVELAKPVAAVDPIPPTPAAAPTKSFPGVQELIDLVAKSYRVDNDTALAWLAASDFDLAIEQRLKQKQLAAK